jgi:hypothetical protein
VEWLFASHTTGTRWSFRCADRNHKVGRECGALFECYNKYAVTPIYFLSSQEKKRHRTIAKRQPPLQPQISRTKYVSASQPRDGVLPNPCAGLCNHDDRQCSRESTGRWTPRQPPTRRCLLCHLHCNHVVHDAVLLNVCCRILLGLRLRQHFRWTRLLLGPIS